MSDALDTIQSYGVVPVISIDSAADALPLADALIAGGLPIIEVTFRTRAAAEVIARLTRERPELLVGAGTVLTTGDLESAADSGAAFGVAPGTNPSIVRRATELGLPFVPGVATPSEIENALSLGCRMLKLFPCEVIGGVSMVDALTGPFGHTGVRLMCTGGISPMNAETYLPRKMIAAVGGAWMATQDDIAQGRWQMISEKCRAALELVRRARRQ